MNRTIWNAALLICLLAVVGCTKPEPPAIERDPAVQPAAPRMRRLLERQYRNSVRDLLGEFAAAESAPATDIKAKGFAAIGASEVALGDAAVYQYELSARAIAKVAAFDPEVHALHLPCSPSGPADTQCHRQFVQRFGRLAWRRALEPDEIERWTEVARAAALESDDFEAGLEYVILGMLQSPNFLFQIEIGEPDPEHAMRRKLTGYEMATRLSYFLGDTTPDAALLERAEAGELETREQVRAAARELLARPAAKEAVRAFYGERFKLADLPNIQKDAAVYPGWSQDLIPSMKTESLMLLDEIVWERDTDYRELYDAPYAWVDAKLAAIYGVEPPSTGFEKRSLPPEHGRSGILTQMSTLALLAHPASTSPTRRGKFVQEHLFCREILPPPPGVDTDLPPDPGVPETMREKLERHQTDPACSGCHIYMDNIGFGLEHFDGIGVWRETDQGLPIDDSGTVQNVADFDGAAGLGALLREHPDVHRCFVRGTFRNATGHFENLSESAALDELQATFEGSGYRVQELLVELAASDAFRHVGRLTEVGETK